MSDREPYAVDRVFAEIAGPQGGVASRPQLERAGISPVTIDRRLRYGLWTRVAPAIYSASVAPLTWRGLAAAALLEGHDDAVVAGRTALAFAGLHGATPPDAMPRLLVPHRKTHESAIADVRQVMWFPDAEIIEVPGLMAAEGHPPFQMTSAARALVDEAAWARRHQWPTIERWIDTANRLRLATYNDVLTSMELAKLGRRRGLGPLRSLLAERLAHATPFEISALESLARRQFDRWGVSSRVEFEVPHPCFPGTRLRADAVVWALRVIFEFDSRAFHLRDLEFEADRRRDARSAELGWRTIRLTWKDFTENRAETRRLVRRACGLERSILEAS